MFPTSISGKHKITIISQAEADLILNRLQDALWEARATDLHRNNNTLYFQGGMLRFSFHASWNILNPVDTCRIDVIPGVPNGVRYQFSTVQLLVMVTVAIILFSIVIAFHPEESFLASPIAPIAGWAWLFGMNYILAAVSLRKFISNALH